MATLSQQDASFSQMAQKLQDTQTGTKTSSSTTVQTAPTSYQNKKLGDVMNDMDSLLARKRYEQRHAMSLQMKQVLTECQEIYEELEDMINSKETPDPAVILSKQIRLNDIENHAVEGVYGVQGQIKPLTEKEQAHHSIMTVIPPGQASVRDLIEQCHQLVTRLLDRAAASHEFSKQFSYDNRKIGDLFEELDDRFSKPSKQAKTKVQQLWLQLFQLYQELKQMSQHKPELTSITQKQQILNELENQAVFGVFGIQGQIQPLDEIGEKAHHIRMEPIPMGQASVRGLLERCHQITTRLLDRIEKIEELKAKQCSCPH